VSQSGARETSARSAPTNSESLTGNTTADTVAVYCATSVPARRCPSSNSTSPNRSGCAKLVPMCSLSGYPPHKIKPSTNDTQLENLLRPTTKHAFTSSQEFEVSTLKFGCMSKSLVFENPQNFEMEGGKTYIKVRMPITIT